MSKENLSFGYQLFHQLKAFQNQIKIHFQFESIQNGYYFFKELYQKNENIFNQIFNEKMTLESKKKIYLKNISFNENRRFFMIVNGDTLKLITEDPYLFSNF